MKRTYLGLVCVALLMVAVSVDAKKRMQFDCSVKIPQAVDAYKMKKYSKVKTILEDARIQCNGNPNMDTVYYYLGMSYLKTKNYLEARSEFERIASDYPDSPLFFEAKFRSAHAVLLSSKSFERDQKETLEAIGMFKEILETYPENTVKDSVEYYLQRAVDKIETKELTNARFYIKMNEYESAVVYFKSFIENFPESKHVDESKLTIAELYLKLDRKSDAAEVLTDLLETGKVPAVLEKARALQNKAQ
ncbi:MAG: outer membrane protein assembly factor BamD [Fibrobacterota bacterium]|nr:outer membrane protein assembly factor BamD [Chitinispirillaceae bacterium]